MSGDMKEGTARKPDITHVRTAFMNHCARACEYGSAKYERANYLRCGLSSDIQAARSVREYLRASISHAMAVLDAVEQWESDPVRTRDELEDAVKVPDLDAKPGCEIGASALPHFSHFAASAMMAVVKAVKLDLLPYDPGRPWEE